MTARRLPPIIPVVFYHGESEWSVPLSISDMIDGPEELKDLAPKLGEYCFRYLG